MRFAPGQITFRLVRFSVVERERTSAVVPVSALAADRYDVVLPRSVNAASFRANAELAGAIPCG
jgi:hypothetical protein